MANYVRNTRTALYDNITTDSVLTAQQLIDGGFLPGNFQNTNAFGQSHVAVLRAVAERPTTETECTTVPATGTCRKLIEALVLTTGGTAIPTARVPRIAAMAGAHAGIVENAGTARGVYNTWCVPFADFGGAGGGSCTNADNRNSSGTPLASAAVAAPATGHLAAALFFNGAELLSSALSRDDTGDPADNTMNAQLIIADGHYVTSPDYYIRDVDRWSSEGAYNISLYESGDPVPMPTCPAANLGDARPALVPTIFTAVSSFSDEGDVPSAIWTTATAEESGTNWVVHMYSRTEANASGTDPSEETDLDTEVAEVADGRILVITKCSR